MAAGSIAASLLLVGVGSARGVEKPTAAAPTYKVKLELRIAGVGRQGCDVEIRPGHAGCSFRPVSKHINGKLGWGEWMLIFDDVQSQSADRDCAFSITIREPGHADRTVHRGLRLAPPKPDQPTPVQTLTCFLNSPSMLARTESERRPR
jgi:hypothetical protein